MWLEISLAQFQFILLRQGSMKVQLLSVATRKYTTCTTSVPMVSVSDIMMRMLCFF